MKIYRSDYFGQEEKSDGSPLTMADTISNEIIMDALKKISPDISVVSEENFSDENLKNLDETYWLVDPLDGTKEFINKTDEFTVNIALINNKKSIFGIVAAPVTGKIWHGSIFDNNEFDNNSVRKLRIVMSKSHKSENDRSFLEFLDSIHIKYEIIEKGSSLKLCSLADNEADVYPRFGPTSEWDIAAADAVLSSHGGSVIKIQDNKELDYAKMTSILNPYFIAVRNNSIKNDYLPLLGDFFKKLV
jgi:3'(2'), 5'-bisphosphate nucleotidase